MKALFNFFKRKKQTIKEVITSRTPTDFKTGEIYQMSAGYYTKHPYYVKIVGVSRHAIRTDIPGEHSSKIDFPSATWDYQVKRMTYIGMGDKYEKLLYNQKLD